MAAALGELGAEVLRSARSVLGGVELLQVFAFLLGEDGEDASDVLAEGADLGDLGGGRLGLLGDAELRELLLGLLELLEEIVLRLGTSVSDLEVRGHVFFFCGERFFWVLFENRTLSIDFF